MHPQQVVRQTSKNILILKHLLKFNQSFNLGAVYNIYPNLNFMFQGQQQQQPCVMCHEHNEQMLMLSCIHDPCVNCAAIHYVQNQPHNSPIYTCAKCGQQTELDQSSVLELQRIYNSQKNKKRYRNQPSTVSQKDKVPNRNYNNDSYQNKESRNYAKPRASELQSYQRKQYDQTPISKYAPVSQPSYTGAATKKGVQQIMYPCADHPEEQLTYFCFTCNRPICPQCAIHGLHKDHQVQTTRKAIKQIKHLLGQDKQKLQAQLNELASNRDRAKRLSKQWSDENKRDQDFIRKKLVQLKAAIAQKEKDLLRFTEVNLQKNCEILRNESLASQKAIDNINNVRRQIQNTLKKQDLVVLQQFNKRDEEANQALQVADREKDKIREQQLKNPLKALDLDLFEQDIDRLIGDIQSIKLSTSAPKS